MLQLMLLLAQTPPPAAPPVVSAASVSTLFAGACSGPSLSASASLRVDWTETSVNRTTHRVDIYENGVLLSSPSSASYTKTVTGYVEGGFFSAFTSNWTYTINVVRLSDNVVVSTTATAVWAVTYGTCS